MEDMEKKLAFLLATSPCISLAGTYGTYARAVRDLIANGVVVREKGEWRNNKDDYPECTRCGYMPQYDPMIDDIYYSDFCPNCGSDMRGAENNG